MEGLRADAKPREGRDLFVYFSPLWVCLGFFGVRWEVWGSFPIRKVNIGAWEPQRGRECTCRAGGGDGVGWGMGPHRAGQGASPHGKGLPVPRCSLSTQGRANVAAGRAGLRHPGMVLAPEPPPIASPLQHVPSHGMSPSPRHIPQPMAGWCSCAREMFSVL